MKSFKNNNTYNVYFICMNKGDSSIFHYGILLPGNIVDTNLDIIYTYDSEDEWETIKERHINR